MSTSRFLMCPPDHFGVEYEINPWMKGQIAATNSVLAYQQWSHLNLILSQHATVHSMSPVQGLPDLVFTANAAVVHERIAVLSSFRYPERRPEAVHYAEWLEADGFSVRTVPRDVLFEGAGDAIFDRGRPLLWFGSGFRSADRARPYLERFIGIQVQVLELCDPRFYHLDTCFCPLERGFLLYYPGAFTFESNRAIERRVPAVQRFAVCEADAVRFTCNAVNIGNQVILNDASGATIRRLERNGFEVTKTPLTEFMRSGRAAKCLSLRLDEPGPF
jgi:N-dimethylarginine dimethylaminohydrolase